jgi:hypothetical protein
MMMMVCTADAYFMFTFSGNRSETIIEKREAIHASRTTSSNIANSNYQAINHQ